MLMEKTLKIVRSKPAAPWVIGTAIVCSVGTYLLLDSQSSSTIYPVTQKGRVFSVDSINIEKGDIVRIINDDGNLRHHAFIRDERFSFDSGDQEPGSTTDIPFTKSGTFNVLCGIHPKMKLIVNVR